MEVVNGVGNIRYFSDLLQYLWRVAGADINIYWSAIWFSVRLKGTGVEVSLIGLDGLC